MKTHLINDYIVEVPQDMSVSIATHMYPGDYDSILYRGVEISTLCSDDPEGTPYNGLYSILWDDGEPECVLTLDEARAIIDAAIAKNPLYDPKVVNELLTPLDTRDDFADILEADFEDDDLGFSAVM